METKKLTEKINEAEQHIQAIEQQFKKNQKSIRITAQKLEDSENKAIQLKEQYEGMRQQRQSILAAGKDAKEATNRISNIRNEMELKEDEAVGLHNYLDSLKQEEPTLINKLKEARTEIPKIRLIHFAGEYNEIASKLASVVQQIWELKYELNETHPRGGEVVSPGGWNFGALGGIPKLYLPDKQDPEKMNWDKTFWDLAAFREEAVRKSLGNRNRLPSGLRAG